MQSFLQRYGAGVIGILSGFDRLRLRGTKRLLAGVGGMLTFLWKVDVLLKDFKAYALKATAEIRRATEQMAAAANRPLIYLASSAECKEERARAIAQQDGITQGLICIFKSVEPCWSYEIHRNRTAQRLELHGGPSKCTHYYHYFLDPEFGFFHARLQSWFPFTIHVCLNGREWLARRLDAAGLGYVRRDNCFVYLDNPSAAQALFDEQVRVDWPGLLGRIAARINPVHDQIFAACPVPYYWSVDQSEWATDILFRSPAELAQLYPRWLRHGLEALGSRDVLRFLGQRVPAHRSVHHTFTGEIVTDLKERPEGIRIKHRLKANAIKMYDKQGSVLRVETTINNTHDLKVYRAKEGDEQGKKGWRILRKGVADLHRTAQVSQTANERYLAALAATEDSTSLAEVTEAICQPVRWQGQRVRALNPLAAADAALLAAVYRGEFTLNGFRNRDLRPLLFGAEAVSPDEARRHSAAVTRKLRLLRAHGLIHKVPKTHRYQISARGRTIIATVMAARQANAAKLTEVA